ncbi:bacillithiol biosynthesis cysteine-adding enzyme BshC [Chryseobacterium taklimakanense]|uniref:bacillithiol biosynthesis cysteine-adding enzyme BshC n=1 Tax=Chryseobacterium taklimakanense TaxID=536441 RepID=UPI001EF47BC1|nr:bacillithiol biosynthesis cysteine-adding enzyme BshC [Chryseobacterium taklimakanense]MCG7281496.1 bacillithiol biosynthesis cysteine-adding enzyme BshC [Chryseobacterium taklimakanense]
MKHLKNIPFQEIESIPQLIKDFLNGKLLDFKEDLFSHENFRHKISGKKSEFTAHQRNILFEVLSDQLFTVELSEQQEANLSALQNDNTFTVVTGHQLNLFTGPAFFIYKILQTIKTAEYLTENFPENNVVPVFWMATEDHDFEEIDHFKTENNYYEIKGKSGGAVGRIQIEDQYFIREFEEEFKDSVYGTELIRWIREAYTPGNTLAQATTILVHRLFSQYGLLIIDGDDPRLKNEMKEIFKAELIDQKLFQCSQDKVNFLTEHYGKVQVNPREINLFYLSETRDRIEYANGKYNVVDKGIFFTEGEILHELETYPERFSPNALMRPVYQEKVLPNLVYIGGNAEIMYWMEIKDYFREIGLQFPILIPRNSMLFLKEKTLKKAEKLDLKTEDFFKNFTQVINHIILKNSRLTSLLDAKEDAVKSVFSEIKEQATETDVTFKNLVAAEEKRQLKSYERMRKRLLRAEKIKQSEKLSRLEKLFLEVHPAKNWQERVLNFSVFYADEGRDWLQNCYSTMNVEKSELFIIQI